MPLQDIETIVFLMLENRSFDHVLGYLATATPPLAVEGLSLDAGWLAAHANGGFSPNRLSADIQQIDDPPHDHAHIAIQLGTAAAPMSGFVDSYQRRSPPPSDPSRIMGFYDATAVPVFDFLARQYAVCDHWFAALPCGTQPNRMMAMSGSSPILDNADFGLPSQPLVYDWLTTNKVAWCSYQWGDFLPFFALMTDWLPEMVTSLGFSALGGRGRFRRYSRFREEWLGTDPMPSVIFIEPEYTDGPHAAPNDDHPPTGIAKGQALVADIYATLTANARALAQHVAGDFLRRARGFLRPRAAIADPVIAGWRGRRHDWYPRAGIFGLATCGAWRAVFRSARSHLVLAASGRSFHPGGRLFAGGGGAAIAAESNRRRTDPHTGGAGDRACPARRGRGRACRTCRVRTRFEWHGAG